MRGWVAIPGVILGLAAAPARAEWRPLSGPEITGALTGTRLQYDGAVQAFFASGRTMYDAGRPSWGYWEVRGDRYCSQWPPAAGWACYDFQRNDALGAYRFIGDSGDVTQGRAVE